jgi:hypothetical protein
MEPVKRALSSDPIKQMASVVPTRQTWSLFEEFKNFAFKGNVVDLAIGAVYLHPAAKYSRLTRRLSQEQKVL